MQPRTNSTAATVLAAAALLGWLTASGGPHDQPLRPETNRPRTRRRVARRSCRSRTRRSEASSDARPTNPSRTSRAT